MKELRLMFLSYSNQSTCFQRIAFYKMGGLDSSDVNVSMLPMLNIKLTNEGYLQ